MAKKTIALEAFTRSAVSATTCATVNQFVVIGDSTAPHNIRWCAIGDPTDWPTPATDDARAKQAGQQVLPSEYGRVTAIAGNDFFGYVFQEQAITKMVYVGGDIVFTFDTFEIGRGCWEYNRLEQVDDAVYYESEFGYHVVTNDVVKDIGIGRVDVSKLPVLPSDDEQRNVVVNKAITTVFFESQNIAYNYKTDQWSAQPAFAGFTYFPVDGKEKRGGCHCDCRHRGFCAQPRGRQGGCRCRQANNEWRLIDQRHGAFKRRI
jgi:hypothetical protein